MQHITKNNYLLSFLSRAEHNSRTQVGIKITEMLTQKSKMFF